MSLPDAKKLQMSREYALLGNYEKSTQFHKEILADTKRYIESIDDPDRSQNWLGVQRSMEQELALLGAIRDELDCLKKPPGRAAGGAVSAPSFGGDDPSSFGGFDPDLIGDPNEPDPDVWQEPTPRREDRSKKMPSWAKGNDRPDRAPAARAPPARAR
jgi:hypothetical protein